VADLWYPGPENCTQVEVGLVHVRAADSILIRYDFNRDGYQILQASKFSWEAGDPVCDPDWQEVAFVQAWARQVEDGVLSFP
jgi:gentisate 1,2-dioxygenase